ncbi:unnamed protein product [Ascophyllum nodosum]
MFFFVFLRSRLRIWSRETGSAVPSRVSLLILHTQAESGAYLTGFLPSSAAASIYLFKTAIRHRVSPEFIGSHNYVPMAFTAESPPAQGQKPSPPTSSSSSIDEEQEEDSTLEFPFLGLLVSGGHCQLLLCEGVGLYTVLGGTVDDALGEAYDKAARLLGLKVGGGGGPAVEALASRGNPKAYPLSVPMQARRDCDFSFAGLKNSFRMAVLRAVEDHERQLGLLSGEEGVSSRKGSEGAGVEGTASTPEESRGAALPESTRADLAASFQHTAVRHLEDKVRRAMDVVCQRPKQVRITGSAAPSRVSLLISLLRLNLVLTYGIPPEFMWQHGSDGNSTRLTLPCTFEDGVMHHEHGDVQEGVVPTAGQGNGARALAVVGGVAANQEIRRRLQALCDSRQPAWRMVVPPARLCTDNGVMVAWAGVERLRKGMSNTAEGQDVYARLPLGRAARADS